MAEKIPHLQIRNAIRTLQELPYQNLREGG